MVSYICKAICLKHKNKKRGWWRRSRYCRHCDAYYSQETINTFFPRPAHCICCNLLVAARPQTKRLCMLRADLLYDFFSTEVETEKRLREDQEMLPEVALITEPQNVCVRSA